MYRRQAFVPPFNALEYVMAISFAVNKSMRECLAITKSRRGQTGEGVRLAWAFKQNIQISKNVCFIEHKMKDCVSSSLQCLGTSDSKSSTANLIVSLLLSSSGKSVVARLKTL